MNESKDIFTLREVETFCRLYMECKLSVLEETELEYVLGCTDFDSSIIDETRKVMGLSRKVNLAKPVSTPKPKAKTWWYGIAAGIAVLVGVIAFFSKSDQSVIHCNGGNEYIAVYSRGQKLSNAEAVKSADMAMTKADSLMNHAALVEEQNLRNTEFIIRQIYK